MNFYYKHNMLLKFCNANKTNDFKSNQKRTGRKKLLKYSLELETLVCVYSLSEPIASSTKY